MNIDTDEAWTQLVAEIERRALHRRRVSVVLASTVPIVLAVFAVLYSNSLRDHTTPLVVRTRAPHIDVLHTPAGDLIPVATDLKIAAPSSVKTRSGRAFHAVVTLTNKSDARIWLGTRGRYLDTYISNDVGKVLGGSRAKPSYAGPGYNAGNLEPGASAQFEMSIAATTYATSLSAPGDPLAAGSYYLWVAIGNQVDGSTPVVGPISISVSP